MSPLAILERHNPASRGLVTVADLYAMVENGEFGPEDRIELLDGEILPMSPKYNKHEVLKSALIEWLVTSKHRDMTVAVETSLTLAEETLLEPDICLYPKRILPQELRAPDVLVVIEVSDSSLSYDVGTKARAYARFGVADYWVVDAVRLEILVHREPVPGGYQVKRRFDRAQQLTALALPEVGLRLDDLDLPHVLWP